MCGIAGAIGVANAAEVCYQMLLALNHRGQTAAGIVSRDPQGLHAKRGFGLVKDVFVGFDFPRHLPGDAAVAQVRYPTAGGADDAHAVQPLQGRSRHGDIVVVHNGNLTNARRLRTRLEWRGLTFRSSTDTELMPLLYGLRREPREHERLTATLGQLEGAFSLLGLTAETLFAARDPHGFRPLFMGRHPNGGLVFASETRAFDALCLGEEEISDIEEVPPGQLIMAQGELARHTFAVSGPLRRCSFEDVYFSMPDSEVEGEAISERRRRLGHQLAERVKERGLNVDIVIAVPNSSVDAAKACAELLGVPYEFGLVRNSYISRTFINPDEQSRIKEVRLKLNPNKQVVRGKRVLVVDDSIVRGTTTRLLAGFLRGSQGKPLATEVHFAISSPEVINPCYWGIDTPARQNLISARHSAAELPRILGADSITFLSEADLLQALGDPAGSRTCHACFNQARVKPVLRHTLDYDGYDE